MTAGEKLINPALNSKTHTRHRWLLLLFIALHLLVAGLAVSKQGLTTDERAYYIYGIRWLHGQVERVEKQDDSKSPITILSAIPRSLIQLLQPTYQANDNGLADMLMGRYLMALYTCIIALYIFTWCRRLWGGYVWVLPVLFFLFDPLVLGHSMLIGSDVATGACTIALFYHLWCFFRGNRMVHWVAASLWLGAGWVAKPSLLLLVPCLVILWLLLLAGGKVRFKLLPTMAYSLAMVSLALLMLNAAYFFKGSFTPMGQLLVQSKAFGQLLADWPIVRHLPLPVPQTYFASVDLLQYHKELGGGTPTSSYPGVFLNGQYKMNGGFWYYYLVVALYKLPLGTLALLLVTIAYGLFSFNLEGWLQRQVWYVWPALWLLLVLSLFNSFQIGLRHALVLYPLFIVAMGGTMHWLYTRHRQGAKVAWVLFAGVLLSQAVYYPHLIPYTNELVTDKKQVFRLMNDSNIDYSQALPAMRQYMNEHPGVEPAPRQPAAGRYIVSMQQLHPYNVDTAITRAWLNAYQPVGHVHYSLLLFEVKR